MCRLMAYLGSQILLADVVTRPNRSITRQSYDARERLCHDILPGSLNGDGFGVGWYANPRAKQLQPAGCESKCIGTDETPCVFTSVTPAWNNENLIRLSAKISSSLIFAHVRAAYPGMPVSEQNCHPFSCGRYMFMHNGGVAGFKQLRRKLVASLSDQIYDEVSSFSSDSSVCFALFLNQLKCPFEKCTPNEIREHLETVINIILDAQEEAGITETSLLNFVVTDGNCVVSSRVVSNPSERPASLYYAVASNFECVDEKAGEYRISHADGQPQVGIVASEPITSKCTDWTPVPPNHVLMLVRGKGGVVDRIVAPIRMRRNSSLDMRHLQISRCLESLLSGVSLPCQMFSGIDLEGIACDDVGQDPRSALGDKTLQSYPILSRVESWSSMDQWSDSGIEKVSSPRSMELVQHVHCYNGEGPGHFGRISALVQHQDCLYTSAFDTDIKVWDLTKHKCINTLKGHTGNVRNLLIHQGNLYSSAAHIIKIWNLQTHECILNINFSSQSREIFSMICICDWIFIGCQDDQIYYLQVDSGARIEEQDTHDHPPLSCSPEHRLIRGDSMLSAQFAMLQEVAGPTFRAPVHGHDLDSGHCAAVHALTELGEYICSGGGDGLVLVWGISDMRLVCQLIGHKASVLAMVTLGPQQLASASRDNTVRVWDLELEASVRTLEGHTDSVVDLVVDRGYCVEDSFLFSASKDLTIRMWSPADWTCRRIFVLPTGHVNSLHVISLAGRCIVGGCNQGTLYQWDLSDETSAAQPLHRIQSVDDGLLASPDTSTSSSARRDGITWREMEKKLRQFVKIKSISGDLQWQDQCHKAAKFLARLLEQLGTEVKLQSNGDDNPIVFGRLGRHPDRPTIVLAGHYDVPNTDMGDSTHDLEAVDGYLHGKGVSDNKGPVIAQIFAVKRLLQLCGTAREMPVNVAFVFEGEHFHRSLGYKEAVRSNLHWFEGAEMILMSNTQWIGEDRPCLTHGMRGMINLTVQVDGPQTDLHSGVHGGSFNEPLANLVKVLGNLVDSHNMILIPGFYEDLRSSCQGRNPCREDTLLSEFEVEKYKKATGIPNTSVHTPQELLSALWCSPSLSIIEIGYGEESRKLRKATNYSIVPRVALAKINVRYVPDQKAEQLIAKFRAHVEHEFAKLRSPNRLEVTVQAVGHWWLGETESPFYKAAAKAIREEWGMEPLYVQEGSTETMTSILEQLLQAPVVQLPIGQASDSPNLPQERIRIVNLQKGCQVMTSLLQELGAQQNEQ
ncbi:hypothetical protein CYMTET_55016 [Cymbomonas tetramitiformis]|uniref:Glutamine amidotransferase type-2 domain-containing protein n=1 Tax=Cymbomonas tetramitiformis TaxID=36881 RepID=A0AAE0BE29_9CHLO|nr:hypothetical protein CYMTET_55016 [Cymbomonas tetramitiformis]